MVFEENNPNLEITPECESSSSSDSYSYLLQDLEDPKNTVREEWEAIERTLYQENGKHVNNPALLKECRLWSETFPHLRIRGTHIQDTRVNQEEKGVGPECVTKCVQTSNAQPTWVKLNQQRESIKKQVVGQLVQRLISKFNLSKENPTGVLQYFDKIDLEKKKGEKHEKKSSSNVPTSTERLEMECYFERGKMQSKNFGNETKLSVKKRESHRKEYSDLSDHLEKEFNVRFLSNSMINEKNNLLKSLKSYSRTEQNFLRKDFAHEKHQEISPYELKKEGIFKREKKVLRIAEMPKDHKVKLDKSSPLDSLSSLVKPFEATKKIDKKYEVLLESILKNKGFDFSESSAVSNKAENPKPEVKSYKESLEKLRINTNYDEYVRRHKQLPKINDFTNNWISRTENNSFKECHTAMKEFKKEQPIRVTKASASSSTLQVSHNNWISKSGSSTETSKRSNFKTEKLAQSNKNEKNEINIEDIKVERPKLFIRSNKNIVPNTYKSSSCGDLHRRKQAVSNLNERSMKSGVEKKKSDLIFRNSLMVNPDKLKSTSKTNFNRDVNLPQIETGIIITELNCRPKIPSRIQPRKYS